MVVAWAPVVPTINWRKCGASRRCLGQEGVDGTCVHRGPTETPPREHPWLGGDICSGQCLLASAKGPKCQHLGLRRPELMRWLVAWLDPLSSCAINTCLVPAPLPSSPRPNRGGQALPAVFTHDVMEPLPLSNSSTVLSPQRETPHSLNNLLFHCPCGFAPSEGFL